MRLMGLGIYVAELRTVNNSGLDKDICITFYGIMHWTLAYTTACTTVQAVQLVLPYKPSVFTACTVERTLNKRNSHRNVIKLYI